MRKLCGKLCRPKLWAYDIYFMQPPTSSRSLPWLRFLFVAALVGLDLWSKAGVFAWLESHPEGMTVDPHGHSRVPLIGEWFAMMRSWNPGMAFGLFGEHQIVLVIGRLIAVSVLAYLLWRIPKSQKFGCTALVLVLAGALGNLYDNLFLGNLGEWMRESVALEMGEVRDFIDVYFSKWDYHFPTFNVADSCISIGAILLFFFWGKGEEANSAEAVEEGAEWFTEKGEVENHG